MDPDEPKPERPERKSASRTADLDDTANLDDTTNENAGDSVARLVHIHKSFGRQAVLKDVSIDFLRGKTTVVLGPSGCGKSVMLKHLIGLLRPDSGEVWYEQQRVDAMREADLGAVRRDFGYLFQHGALFDSLTVEDNVAFPLVTHTKLSAAQRRETVRRVLDQVGLAEVAGKMPADLSGGQQKRVALARAIVRQPKVILYDEPTTGLDPIRADVINELIIKLRADLDASSIVVTHDLGSAFKIADEMVMLYDGKVMLRGRPEDFRTTDHPLVQWFLRGQSATTVPDIAGSEPTFRFTVHGSGESATRPVPKTGGSKTDGST